MWQSPVKGCGTLGSDILIKGVQIEYGCCLTLKYDINFFPALFFLYKIMIFQEINIFQGIIILFFVKKLYVDLY